MNCIPRLTNVAGIWECSECGYCNTRLRTEPFIRNCPTTPIEKTATGEVAKTGPGIRLHELLRERFNLDFTTNCGCRQWIQKMDIWGPDGCRKNIDKIVSKMLGEAKRRKWVIDGKPLLTVAAQVGTLTSLGIAYARWWARKIVFEAIERSELDDKR